jgi:hypothetical protein
MTLADLADPTSYPGTPGGPATPATQPKQSIESAHAAYQAAATERHALRARAAALEAALTLSGYQPVEGDSAHGLRLLAAQAETVLQGRQLGATQLRLELETVREQQRAFAERFRAAEEAWERARAMEAARLARELRPRHQAAVRALAAAVEQLSAAIAAERSARAALPAELAPRGHDLLPNASGDLLLGTLDDDRSLASAWTQRMRLLGLLA